ncbi:MAG: hypothetical protein JJE47_13520 [Acidimicrobiia bacterium]|nr:hypothetical protein [Acidimicrobiia bacterium]MDH3262320.1 hypothetical protein [Acidimicrobiia bacterium]
MSEIPTQGVFDFVLPGEDIVLHRGDGVVDGAAGSAICAGLVSPVCPSGSSVLMYE